ncbi:MAG: bifunctional 5,10-methylene-tetrahydrofolate dehydrogenase/5,10-methylene-tetrahydrofolate cyclohydrolase [Bacteroidales bacterium]|nr:bifunctional 5,10-methylene-tetrahydrofolate dehydrogenase/5,10-methylene-tetrahydrofolate cyclohydrolase [Bacteroidales bacterium]
MIKIDGKETARQIRQEIAAEVKDMIAQGRKQPHLAAILVGHDGGSETYVANKIKACEECGFKSSLLRFEDNISEAQLLDTVAKLNADPDVDGFIVQLPLPAHISEEKVTRAIAPTKDVDGFHPQNVGLMSIGEPAFISATPQGIIELIRRYNIPTAGKHAVVIGRSNIVGRPMSILLSQKGVDCTVTLCHSRTPNIAEICRQADIIVAAIGKPGFVTADMVSPGATVIDVGTTRVADPTAARGWRLRGDVDFESVAPKCDFITPVPGGVGPMTICSLMQNTLKAAKLNN